MRFASTLLVALFPAVVAAPTKVTRWALLGPGHLEVYFDIIFSRSIQESFSLTQGLSLMQHQLLGGAVGVVGGSSKSGAGA